MKIIKTFLAICTLSLLPLGPLCAQDLASATEIYNAGATALNENNYSAAIESFNKALKMLEGLGEEGVSLMKECKDILPQIYLRYGKELASKRNIDEAIVQIKKAIESAKANSMENVATEAKDILPQLLMADADSFINEGKFAEAIAGYKKVLTIEPENATAYLRIGIAECKMNNEEGAIGAFEKAAGLGEKEDALKQLSVIFLKKSAASWSVKNYAGAFENAKKANSYCVTGQGNKLTGLSAAQIKKYDDAIPALEAYYADGLETKEKNMILYVLATAYEAKGNTAKACGYYKQVVSDPKYKQMAEYKISQFNCN